MGFKDPHDDRYVDDAAKNSCGSLGVFAPGDSSMGLERKISLLFAVNALINWTVSFRGIIDPVGMSLAFNGPPPEYSYVVRMWTGFVFMFGCMFWETSRDVRRKAALVKYNWIEKTITASAVTIGYFAGDVSDRLMTLIVFTNWAWIPFLFYYDMSLRNSMAVPVGASAASR